MLVTKFALPRECLIYAAGGGALLVAPRQQAPKIKQRIEELYVTTTLTATTTAVDLPVRTRAAHWPPPLRRRRTDFPERDVE